MDCGNELFPERLEITGNSAGDAAEWGSRDGGCSGSRPQTLHNIHTQHTCGQPSQRNICGHDHQEDLGFAGNRTGENRGLWPQVWGGKGQDRLRREAGGEQRRISIWEKTRSKTRSQFSCSFALKFAMSALSCRHTELPTHLRIICECAGFNRRMHSPAQTGLGVSVSQGQCHPANMWDTPTHHLHPTSVTAVYTLVRHHPRSPWLQEWFANTLGNGRVWSCLRV